MIACSSRIKSPLRRAFFFPGAERKDFTPTEAVAIGRLIEEQHRLKIAAVQHEQRIAAGKASAAKRSDKSTTTLIEKPVRLGATDETAAKAVGMSPSSYHRAKTVVAAAEADPAKLSYPVIATRTATARSTPGRYMPHQRAGRRVLRDPGAVWQVFSIVGAIVGFSAIAEAG